MKPFISNASRFDINTGMHDDAGVNSVLIQIIDEREEFPVPKMPFKHVHQFVFDDVSDPKDPTSITDLQAKQIADIMREALDNNRNIICHCHAGICRSGAVVEVGVQMGFNPPDRIRWPNPLVLMKLQKALGLPVAKYTKMELEKYSLGWDF